MGVDTVVVPSRWLMKADTPNLVHSVGVLTMGSLLSIVDRSSDSLSRLGEAQEPRMWMMVEDKSMARLAVGPRLWAVIESFSAGGEWAILDYVEVLNRVVVVMKRKSDATTRHVFVVVEVEVLVTLTFLYMDSVAVRMGSQDLGWHEHRWRKCAVAGPRAK